MNITIYHNPNCSKSRKSLDLLLEAGVTPTIVEYLVNPPDADTLRRLARLLDLPLSSLLRRGEDDFKNAGDSIPLGDEAALGDWLHDHPRVLERPIVVDEDQDRAVIGRPPENVINIVRSD